MERMRDDEIIKALECCRCDDEDMTDCESCPLCSCGNLFECHTKLSTEALDLIKRQRSEIEQLNREIAGIYVDMETRDIQELKTAVDNLKAELAKPIQKMLDWLASVLDKKPRNE